MECAEKTSQIYGGCTLQPTELRKTQESTPEHTPESTCEVTPQGAQRCPSGTSAPIKYGA